VWSQMLTASVIFMSSITIQTQLEKSNFISTLVATPSHTGRMSSTLPWRTEQMACFLDEGMVLCEE
jgi:hypothetical protein